MVVVPAMIPDTTPAPSTLATATSVEDQSPPAKALLNVIV
jgi:hypothetical protein